MRIIYEDSYIIVVQKPVGVLSQKDDKCRENMIDLLKDYCGQNNESTEIYPVHRLDRNVGGVMVFAKTAFASSELNRQIQNGEFFKQYYAVVHGTPDREGIMEDLLFKDSHKGKSFVVKRERRGVKKAKLFYELLQTADTQYGILSLCSVYLYTGRTHQIRVQFSSRKMPLAGDGKYGGSDNGLSIGLFSQKIGFNHPKTGERLTFTALPEAEPFTFFNLLDCE